FKAVSDAVGLEIVVYNIPGRSGVKIAIETLARLAEIPNIVAVKDATGDIDMASETVAICGEKLSVLSGNDSMNLPILAVGGTGTISVVSNIVPDRVKKMVDLYLKGETKKALEVHLALWQLSKVLFLETNPIPVKAAAHLLKMIPSEEIRLPLTPLETPNREKLRVELKKIGLL
ncbi:MAG: dihydrodipicolinate synthase family protein, partial [Spirochaetia bacterium]|nr:dihydrodipicolinate synthase family protein [Spirochaetia bacterium]